MSGISQSIIFPKPSNERERGIFKEIDDFFRSIIAILDRGITFEDNFDSRQISFTSNATPGTEDAVSHDLGKVPLGYIIYSRDKAGVLYDSGTTFTSSNIYVKCNVASVAFKIIVF